MIETVANSPCYQAFTGTYEDGRETVAGKTAREVDDRVSRLEKLVGGGLLLILGWLGMGTHYLFELNGDIRAIKQAALDHGSAITSAIEHPGSNEQLAANLNLAGAQLQLARANQTKPDKVKLQRLSRAITQTALDQPSFSQVWPAAGQLVSYESQLGQPKRVEENSCLDQIQPDGGPPYRYYPQIGFKIRFHDCTFDLADTSGFFRVMVSTTKDPQVLTADLNRVGVYLLAERVKIVYHGGPMLPIVQLLPIDCTFDWQLPNTPPPLNARSLTTQLLASNLEPTEIKLPIPSQS